MSGIGLGLHSKLGDEYEREGVQIMVSWLYFARSRVYIHHYTVNNFCGKYRRAKDKHFPRCIKKNKNKQTLKCGVVDVPDSSGN